MTIARLRIFIEAYQRQRGGESPPWVELSAAEADELRHDLRVRGFVPANAGRPINLTRLYGVPIRVVEG